MEESQLRALVGFRERPRPLMLECDVQHYAWGDVEFLPSLLGEANPDRRPYAELWMGAHPDLPSRALLGDTALSLKALIDAVPDATVGPQAAKDYGGLPFLFKVLCAGQPLSIQAHPTIEQAQAGFEREQRDGIPIDAPHRNYKDRNHKPELIAALTDFYGLRGFRPLDEIAELFSRVPELRLWLDASDDAADPAITPERLRAIYASIMRASQAAIDEALAPLIHRLRERDADEPFGKDDREYWLLAADRAFSRDGHHDRGLISVLLLNLVHLRPGQAMYLPAGVLHAYLQGSGIELMANSNNVLRGGLTPKHVDVDELLATVQFEGETPTVLQAEPAVRGRRFRTPAPEFELWPLELAAEATSPHGAPHPVEILICTEGGVRLHYGAEGSLDLKAGHSVFVPLDVPYVLEAMGGAAQLYRATLPS